MFDKIVCLPPALTVTYLKTEESTKSRVCVCLCVCFCISVRGHGRGILVIMLWLWLLQRAGFHLLTLFGVNADLANKSV